MVQVVVLDLLFAWGQTSTPKCAALRCDATKGHTNTVTALLAIHNSAFTVVVCPFVASQCSAAHFGVDVCPQLKQTANEEQQPTPSVAARKDPTNSMKAQERLYGIGVSLWSSTMERCALWFPSRRECLPPAQATSKPLPCARVERPGEVQSSF
jgi:hypothetical protein